MVSFLPDTRRPHAYKTKLIVFVVRALLVSFCGFVLFEFVWDLGCLGFWAWAWASRLGASRVDGQTTCGSLRRPPVAWLQELFLLLVLSQLFSHAEGGRQMYVTSASAAVQPMST